MLLFFYFSIFAFLILLFFFQSNCFMHSLLSEVKTLQSTPVRQEIEHRLSEFSSFVNKPSKEWFSELCFCILTANSKAKTALSIQSDLGSDGFCSACAEDITLCIRSNKHRFHNNKTKFIVEARKHLDVKEKVQAIAESEGEPAVREWLVKNIKGIGYKEASHFLRNVGYTSLAILDRHILNLFVEYNIILEKPVSLSRKKYIEIEEKFILLSEKAEMTAAELDLYLWFMKTGEVLK